MVFCFVQNFFFGQHELEYFFLSRKARIFFPEYNIRLYDKNTESHYFFFPPPKSEYFFQVKDRELVHHVQVWKNVKVYFKWGWNKSPYDSVVFHFDDFDYGRRSQPYYF